MIKWVSGLTTSKVDFQRLKPLKLPAAGLSVIIKKTAGKPPSLRPALPSFTGGSLNVVVVVVVFFSEGHPSVCSGRVEGFVMEPLFILP